MLVQAYHNDEGPQCFQQEDSWTQALSSFIPNLQ